LILDLTQKQSKNVSQKLKMEKKPVKKKIIKIKEKITGSHKGDQEFIPKKIEKKKKSSSVL
jgi:hypothetical protein